MDTHSPTEICFGTCACIEDDDEDEDVQFLPMQSHPTRFAFAADLLHLPELISLLRRSSSSLLG
ncbi:hypothetical protein C4D60_Mb06t24530 [Musa balbisiana]|uniref:Uncharacterized protein n=1 Tax=Musa balbisiana TaxID=52838 RepID=A0A4V4H456_MUSBA|nr:hypothetical protein C4D60_Mb06t24530 [Musa balbisiana]